MRREQKIEENCELQGLDIVKHVCPFFDIFETKMDGFALNTTIILSVFKNSSTLSMQHTNVERMKTTRLVTIQNLCFGFNNGPP